MIFSAVLRRSLAFGPEHVEWLGKQIAHHYPGIEFRPFTDTKVSIPHEILHEGLPAWWSKMEALRRIAEDVPVVMIDLDTVVLRNVALPVPPEGRAYMQTGPRNIDKIWGGFQISTPSFRRAVTDEFFQDPVGAMNACNGCDQIYYETRHREKIISLNAVLPDGLVSYKLHVLKRGLDPNNAFVLFHGLPRPWSTDHEWVPPLH